MCVVCAALGVGAGWLVWGDNGNAKSGGVYAGMSQDAIDRAALEAINLDAHNQGIHNRAIDANCQQRRFQKNVFDCGMSWENSDPYGFNREWAVRFDGNVVASVKRTSLP